MIRPVLLFLGAAGHSPTPRLVLRLCQPMNSVREGYHDLTEILHGAAALRGDRPAFRCGPAEITHRQFHERSLRMASALQARGIRAGDRVAIVNWALGEFALSREDVFSNHARFTFDLSTSTSSPHSAWELKWRVFDPRQRATNRLWRSS